jgi:hypothetical protein
VAQVRGTRKSPDLLVVAREAVKTLNEAIEIAELRLADEN